MTLEERAKGTKTRMDDNEASLRQLVYHSDARITAMEGAIGALSDGQLRQEQKMDQLIATISAPKNVNWSGWAAIGLALIVGLFGASTWVQDNLMTTLQPVVTEVNQNYDRVRDLSEKVSTLRVDSATIAADKNHIEDRLNFFEEWLHRQDIQITRLQVLEAARPPNEG
jgi:hypothetical protein